MSDCSEIHDLLYGHGVEHCLSALSGGHDVGVVAKDARRRKRQRARSNMQHNWKLLAAQLVQIRNHQQQSLKKKTNKETIEWMNEWNRSIIDKIKYLRSSERGHESACWCAAVYGTSRTALALHLRHLHNTAQHSETTFITWRAHSWGEWDECFDEWGVNELSVMKKKFSLSKNIFPSFSTPIVSKLSHGGRRLLKGKKEELKKNEMLKQEKSVYRNGVNEGKLAVQRKRIKTWKRRKKFDDLI